MKFILSILLLVVLVESSYQAANYSHALAAELAPAAFASYCSIDQLKAMNCGQNCKKLKGYDFVSYSTHSIGWLHTIAHTAFVNHKLKRFVMAFRGTTSATQLAYEVTFSKGQNCLICGDNFPHATIVEYFQYYYMDKIRPDFIADIKEQIKKYPDYTFYVVGHSMGGAFATLAALDIGVQGIIPKQQIHLYSFGSPRIGDINFVNALKNYVGEQWRIVHNRDLITHLPPCIIGLNGKCSSNEKHLSQHNYPLFNTWHTAPEVLYNGDNTKYEICEDSEDPKCGAGFTVPNFFDHINYLGAKMNCFW